MVPATVRRSVSSANGLQPLRLERHWRQVINLIEVAFGEALDADARRALHSMRLPPGLATLIAFFDRLAMPGEGMMPGFVWLEDGKVVGTVSARRIRPFDQGWLVSNVAVHPDWQGRGIGRALVEASLDFAQDHGGTWVALQVRDDNVIAQQLYHSLGFQSIGETVRLRKTELDAVTDSSHIEGLRPARWYDGGALYRVARTLTPHDVLWADALNRDLYKTSTLNHIIAQAKGFRRRWWVREQPGHAPSFALGAESRFRAAVGIEIDPRTPWHRLRLLTSPKVQDKQLASDLIAFGLSQLADAVPLPVEIEQPASDNVVQSALTHAGFERIYALIHMRLDL